MNNYIITKIQGGLGNQLFQWAYGRFLSIKNDRELYIDIKNSRNRRFALYELSNITEVPVVNKLNQYRVIVDNFIYSELLDLEGDIYLDGYWQSEKYFNTIEDVIREDFAPSDLLKENLLNTPFIDSNIVSMHIRRTDYITSNGFHPIQPISYYERALEIIGDYDYIFVFSDDIDWCRENLKFEKMIFMTGFTDIEDLYLMSMCKNNIIANSSFSWWGAWLNNNPNKIVVAPLNWFGQNAGLNSSDIVPDKWVRI